LLKYNSAKRWYDLVYLFDKSIECFSLHNQYLAVGGSFTRVQNRPDNFFTILNLETGLINRIVPSVDDIVTFVGWEDNGTIWLAGNFIYSENGVLLKKLAKYDVSKNKFSMVVDGFTYKRNEEQTVNGIIFYD